MLQPVLAARKNRKTRSITTEWDISYLFNRYTKLTLMYGHMKTKKDSLNRKAYFVDCKDIRNNKC